MKKRDYDKRVLHDFKKYNTEEIEEYLNKMAEKGYFLLEINQHQMFFNKEEPRKLRHSVVYIRDNEERNWYKEYSNKVWWKVVYETDKFQICTTEDTEKPFVESDESKFEMLQKIRNKRMVFDGLKLSLLILVGVLAAYYIGLMNICLSFTGFSLVLMSMLYGLLLASEIIDTLFWKKQCKRNLTTKEKLNFRYSNTKKIINKVINIILVVCIVALSMNSIYRLFLSWQLGEIEKSNYIFIMIFVYLIGVPLAAKVRGELSKRGGYEKTFYRLILMIAAIVITWVAMNGLGSKEATFAPEDFQIEYSKEYSYEQVHTGKSIFGSKEYYKFSGVKQEGYGTSDFAYYLYKSKFPGVINQIKGESLRTEHITEYLKIYEQNEAYSIYTAFNQKVYPEYAVYEEYDTNLEDYDGCILIESPNELFIFYYKDFGNVSIDDMLKSLGYKE